MSRAWFDMVYSSASDSRHISPTHHTSEVITFQYTNPESAPCRRQVEGVCLLVLDSHYRHPHDAASTTITNRTPSATMPTLRTLWSVGDIMKWNRTARSPTGRPVCSEAAEGISGSTTGSHGKGSEKDGSALQTQVSPQSIKGRHCIP